MPIGKTEQPRQCELCQKWYKPGQTGAGERIAAWGYLPVSVSLSVAKPEQRPSTCHEHGPRCRILEVLYQP